MPAAEQRGEWGCLQTMRVHGVSNAVQSAIRSVSERVDKERSDWQSTEQLLIVLWAKLQAGAPCAERCRLTTSPSPKQRIAAGFRRTLQRRVEVCEMVIEPRRHPDERLLSLLLITNILQLLDFIN